MGRPRQQTFAEAIDGLRAAAPAATTVERLDAVRAAIRAAFTPQQVDTTDLWAVCERKRIELEAPDPC